MEHRLPCERRHDGRKAWALGRPLGGACVALQFAFVRPRICFGVLKPAQITFFRGGCRIGCPIRCGIGVTGPSLRFRGGDRGSHGGPRNSLNCLPCTNSHTYLYLYIHIIYIYINLFIYTFASLYIHIHLYKYTYMCIFTCVYIYINSFISMDKCLSM